jgi:hypothetical protein
MHIVSGWTSLCRHQCRTYIELCWWHIFIRRSVGMHHLSCWQLLPRGKQSINTLSSRLLFWLGRYQLQQLSRGLLCKQHRLSDMYLVPRRFCVCFDYNGPNIELYGWVLFIWRSKQLYQVPRGLCVPEHRRFSHYNVPQRYLLDGWSNHVHSLPGWASLCIHLH